MTSEKPTQKRYPLELKERAVRMVVDLQRQDRNDHAVVGRVARQLGVGVESLRTWVKQSEVDGGRRPGATTVEHDELIELRKEVKELRRAAVAAEMNGRPRKVLGWRTPAEVYADIVATAA